MDRRRFIAGTGLAACTLLASPALAGQSRRAAGLLVEKSGRSLFLVNASGEPLKRYPILLGSNPIGHKRRQGDGRTPEGAYTLAYEVPQSRFHLSYSISYPNRFDRQRAHRRGVSPGGDICVHGTGGPTPQRDWTAGCIALSDTNMDDLYRFLRPGMPITIRA